MSEIFETPHISGMRTKTMSLMTFITGQLSLCDLDYSIDFDNFIQDGSMDYSDIMTSLFNPGWEKKVTELREIGAILKMPLINILNWHKNIEVHGNVRFIVRNCMDKINLHLFQQQYFEGFFMCRDVLDRIYAESALYAHLVSFDPKSYSEFDLFEKEDVVPSTWLTLSKIQSKLESLEYTKTIDFIQDVVKMGKAYQERLIVMQISSVEDDLFSNFITESELVCFLDYTRFIIRVAESAKEIPNKKMRSDPSIQDAEELSSGMSYELFLEGSTELSHSLLTKYATTKSPSWLLFNEGDEEFEYTRFIRNLVIKFENWMIHKDGENPGVKSVKDVQAKIKRCEKDMEALRYTHSSLYGGDTNLPTSTALVCIAKLKAARQDMVDLMETWWIKFLQEESVRTGKFDRTLTLNFVKYWSTYSVLSMAQMIEKYDELIEEEKNVEDEINEIRLFHESSSYRVKHWFMDHGLDVSELLFQPNVATIVTGDMKLKRSYKDLEWYIRRVYSKNYDWGYSKCVIDGMDLYEVFSEIYTRRNRIYEGPSKDIRPMKTKNKDGYEFLEFVKRPSIVDMYENKKDHKEKRQLFEDIKDADIMDIIGCQPANMSKFNPNHRSKVKALWNAFMIHIQVLIVAENDNNQSLLNEIFEENARDREKESAKYMESIANIQNVSPEELRGNVGYFNDLVHDTAMSLLVDLQLGSGKGGGDENVFDQTSLNDQFPLLMSQEDREVIEISSSDDEEDKHTVEEISSSEEDEY